MVLLLLSLLSAVFAQEYPKDNYIFSYAVEDNYSGNQFGHTENRHGGDTAGAYHVRLPDGRLQTVQYTVDHLGGYRATVVYEGGREKAATAPAKFVHSGGGARPYFPAPAQPHLSPAYNFINHQPPPPPPPSPPPPPPPPPSALLLPSYSVHQPHYLPLQPDHAQPAYFILPQEHNVFPSSPVPTPSPPPPPPPPTLPPPSPPPPPPSQEPQHAAAPAKTNKHHLAFSVPLVKPPEHHAEDDVKTPDPYLASPEELKGRNFDSPFWYPQHRHIVKGYRNKDRGDKEDHRDYKVI